jgi:hypothetical protein
MYGDDVVCSRLGLSELKIFCFEKFQAQYAKADGFFMYKTLPKYFDQMQLFVNIMKCKREMAAQAEEFGRENILSRFFYSWHTALEESQENRLAERMVNLLLLLLVRLLR